MRSLPNMVVLSPCDEIETNRAIKAASEHDGPVYIRLGRLAVELFMILTILSLKLVKALKLGRK